MHIIGYSKEMILRASLCGLLHDIGKPVLRYILRQREGLEKDVEDSELRKILEKLGVKRHEELGGEFLESIELADICREQSYILDAIKLADTMAAAERGIEKSYERLRDLWSEIERLIGEKIGSNYKHYITPLLSPLWMLKVLNRNSYDRFLGPTAEQQRFSRDEALKELSEFLKPILEAIESQSPDPEKIASEISRILTRLKNEGMWYPSTLLTSDVLRDLRPRDYQEAQNGASYRSIVEYVFSGLKWAIDIYGLSSGRGLKTGFVETIAEIMKYSLSLVPSAVYVSIVPDIGLYSHSKLVSAISGALVARYPEHPKSYRLLIIDTRGIQSFISAPVKAKAASRVIRGRSLLVELALESVAELALKIFGGLPSVNIVVSEGGTLLIVVPDYDEHEIESRVADLKKLLDGVKWLKWSVAYSASIDESRASYINALVKGGGFPEVLEDLEKRLAIAKIRDQGEMLGIEAGESDIEGFDAITWEPVLRREIINGLGFRVDRRLAEPEGYASIISGGKLEPEDLVGEATHLSLVAGSVARNLIAVVSIYLYSLADGKTAPAIDKIRSLWKDLYRCLCEKFKCGITGFDKTLYMVLREYQDTRVALIPLESLGALHILISIKDPPESGKEAVIEAVKAIQRIVSGCGGVIESILRIAEASKRIDGKVRIKFINVAAEFLEALRKGDGYNAVKEIISRLIGMGFDVSISTFYTGTYHPVDEKGSLVDLDTFDVIAVSKIDGDQIGEIRSLLSLSPSRLVSFSDLLTLSVVGKLHLALSGMKNSNVVMLYAGGDDVSLYGEWRDVLHVIHRIYNEIAGALRPLSFSTGVSIDKGDAPLLIMFSRARNALESVKRSARGSICIEEISAQVINVNGSITLVRAIPADLRGWPSQRDLISLRNLAELLEERVLEDLRVYKGDIHMLSYISDEALKIFKRVSEGGDALLDLVKIGNMLSYYCARRRDDLGNLEKLLRIRVCPDQGSSIREALMRIANAKPLLDLLYLALRLPSIRK